jgi:hypothetical protein
VCEALIGSGASQPRSATPSEPCVGRIRQTLGITEPLPEEAWRQQPREISDELVATLGACLAAARQATLAELGEATGVPILEVRLALRRLAKRLGRQAWRSWTTAATSNWHPTGALNPPGFCGDSGGWN